MNRIIKKENLIALALLFLFTLLSFQKLAFYVRFDFNFILLLIVLPFVFIRKSNEKSIRYGIVAIVLLILYPFLKLSSIFFFAYVCSLFFIYESLYGKISGIPLFFVIIVSPVAIFLSEIVGFEIRLYLSSLAATLLKIVNPDYIAKGNIILLGSQEFRVDPECMGLKMVLLSLFIVLIFIAWRIRTKKADYSLLLIILNLIIAFVLVIISNLFRIVLITLMKSLPGSLSHEIIGIACFVVYVVMPLWFITGKLSKEIINEKINTDFPPIRPLNFWLITSFILGFMIYLQFFPIGNKNTDKPVPEELSIPVKGLSCQIEEHDVLKLENEEILIYIKPALNFYSADHSPVICWKGSGYKIRNEQIIEVEGKNIYYGELNHNNDILYTCWWYDSGEDKTISQFRWRFQNLIKNENYRLVNLISDDFSVLKHETRKLLNKNIFEQ